MTKETMNIHKALSELKVINGRVDTTIANTEFVAAKKRSSEKVSGIPVDEFKKDAQAGHQSLISLIARRNAIKNAVVQSNANTKVVIGGTEYTVAEAIEMKTTGMTLYKNYLRELKRQYADALKKVEQYSPEALEDRANSYVQTTLGTQKEGTKIDPNLVKNLHDDYINRNTFDLIDPIGIKEEIAALEKYITEFESEVDHTLSTSNASIKITIEY